MAEKADPKQGKVPVKLLLEHEDRGRLHEPGAVLWLRPDQRDRLVKAQPPVAVDCADCGGAAPVPAPTPVPTPTPAPTPVPIPAPAQEPSDPKPKAAKAADKNEVKSNGV